MGYQLGDFGGHPTLNFPTAKEREAPNSALLPPSPPDCWSHSESCSAFVSKVVQKLTQMIGKNVKLYDMVLQFLRTLFLRTRNVHYCTLRAELLMSLHDLDISEICTVDPCHKVPTQGTAVQLSSPSAAIRVLLPSPPKIIIPVREALLASQIVPFPN